ncbi:MAG TPA: hypothetical protein VH089_17075 [Streptosporangiaceae bacterium]|nr:hypothetical protein [Streptosporangiaceae bacterium]
MGTEPTPWAARRARVADRLLARLLGTSLDRQLAAGQAPEAGRLLAVRAQQIVTLRHRRQLAGNWERLLTVAADGPPSRPRALLCRGRIVAAAADVHELAGHLRAPLPVAATGVAAAQVLLTDATGPVYNRRDRTGLDTRLRAISALLDPAVPLQSLVRSNT